jgi:hypothetical protein
MTNETINHLRRQAEWQSRQKDLPWPEKVRQAELLRDAALKLRESRPVASGDTQTAK